MDQPSIIVGQGRVGLLLAELGERRGLDDVIVKRGDPIPADHPGPIYVCTRNDDLSAVLAQVTTHHHRPSRVNGLAHDASS